MNFSSSAELLNLAMQRHRAGNIQEAEQLYERILQAEPQLADALHLLGLIAHARSDFDAALQWITQAIHIRPQEAVFHNNLGIAYASLGEQSLAVQSYRNAIALKPEFAEAYNGLGIALKDQGDYASAVAAYQQALKLRPQYAAAWNNLSNACQELGDYQAAVQASRNAIQLQPNYANAYNSLGAALHELNELTEATHCYRRAWQLGPQNATVINSLATVLLYQGEREEAGKLFRQAISLKPDYAHAQFNLATWELAHGQFASGWSRYEWRFQMKLLDADRPCYSQPLWQGEALGEKTLLLHAEQGLGDTLQFIRYAKLLRDRGVRTLCTAPSALVPLLHTSALVDELVSRDAVLSPFDVYLPLLSLPRIFQTDLATIPRDVPYLTAKPELITHWRERLANYRGLRIGINWRGRAGVGRWQLRNLPLNAFARLAALSGIHWFSLQQGELTLEERAAAEQLSLIDFSHELDTQHGAFMDTAAIMKNLDLVISSDTSIAHLAGALGTPVWLLLPFAPDWRWLLERDDSPWYPSMQLFRQPQLNNWHSVMQQVQQALENWKQAERPTP